MATGGDDAAAAIVTAAIVTAAFAAGDTDELDRLNPSADLCRIYDRAARAAFAHGRVGALEWLIGRGYLSMTDLSGLASYGICCAACCGSVELLQWLVDRGTPLCMFRQNCAARHAAAGGHIPALDWLFHHGCATKADFRLFDFSAVCDAVVRGFPSVLEWVDGKGYLSPDDYLIVQHKTQKIVASQGNYESRGGNAERAANYATIRRWLAEHASPPERLACVLEAWMKEHAAWVDAGCKI